MRDEKAYNQGAPLSQEQQLYLKELQAVEADFCTLCSKIGTSRELSLAATNMQQAAMWAARHVLGGSFK